jgi:hypothetical protein
MATALPGGLTSPDSPSAAVGQARGPGKSAVLTENVQTRGAQMPAYTPANFSSLRLSATAKVDTGQQVISVSASSGAVILTLPSAYYAHGQFIHIIKTDSTANQVSAVAASGDTLARPAAKAWPVAQYETVTLVAQVDAAGAGIWYVLQ